STRSLGVRRSLFTGLEELHPVNTRTQAANKAAAERRVIGLLGMVVVFAALDLVCHAVGAPPQLLRMRLKFNVVPGMRATAYRNWGEKRCASVYVVYQECRKRNHCFCDRIIVSVPAGFHYAS